MRLICLVAMLPALFFGACLLEPKTGCRTTDDCASGRACVAGTCQPERRDAGLDASSDKQSSGDLAIDLSERLNPDLAGALDGVPDHVAPDAPATIDAPDNLAGLDARTDKPCPGDVAAAPSETLGPDLAADVDGALDLAPQAVDAAPDIPAAIDALGSPPGQDASLENQPSWDVAIDLPETPSPDLAGDRDAPMDSAPPPVDAAPDVPVVPTIDASLSLDVPQGGRDASDGADGVAQGPVSWEDFRARCPREPWTGGRYIVDGDLALDEADLGRYYDAWFAAAGVPPENLAPMGASAVWPFADSFLLSYCISTDFGDNLAVLEAAMGAATASWSDRVGVEYTYLPEEDASCNADNANVTFDVSPVFDAGYAAVSFFPDSPRSARSLLVDSSAFVVGSDGANLEAILRHQLGHTLGFQHEHLWLDPACTSEVGTLAVQIANYDIDSVMHLPTCRPSELGGTIQTEGDFAGAIAIYGLSPALIVGIAM